MKYVRLIILVLLFGTLSSNIFAQGIVSRNAKGGRKHTTSKTNSSKIKEEDLDVFPSQSSPEKIPYSKPIWFANGQGYIDLGLPSGTKWAYTNIGAKKPEEKGDYFAYSETDIKQSYEKNNNSAKYKWSFKGNGIFSFNDILSYAHDPAKVNWGFVWSLPTKSDWLELLQKCKWDIVSYQNNIGYEVTGPNGNSIFIGANGIMQKRNLTNANQMGGYLSSDFGGEEVPDSVYVFSFNFNGGINDSEGPSVQPMGPYHGFSVRPVLRANLSMIPQEELNEVWSEDSYEENTRRVKEISKPDGFINGYGYVDLGLPSGLKWAYANVGCSNNIIGYGYSYPWGEIQTYHTDRVKKNVSYGKDIEKLKSKHIIDDLGNLSRTHDAANAKMGSTWRMASKDDFEELINNCEWTRFEYNGMGGCKVVGPNGHSIFIPDGIQGSRSGRASWDESYYWTSTALDQNQSYILSSRHDATLQGWKNRREGLPIRGVSK